MIPVERLSEWSTRLAEGSRLDDLQLRRIEIELRNAKSRTPEEAGHLYSLRAKVEWRKGNLEQYFSCLEKAEPLLAHDKLMSAEIRGGKLAFLIGRRRIANALSLAADMWDDDLPRSHRIHLELNTAEALFLGGEIAEGHKLVLDVASRDLSASEWLMTANQAALVRLKRQAVSYLERFLKLSGRMASFEEIVLNARALAQEVGERGAVGLGDLLREVAALPASLHENFFAVFAKNDNCGPKADDIDDLLTETKHLRMMANSSVLAAIS